MVEFVVVITAQQMPSLVLPGLPCGRYLTRFYLCPELCPAVSLLLPDVSSTGVPPPLAGCHRRTLHTLSHPARARGETFPCTRTLHLHQQIISLVQVDTKARMHQTT